MLSEFSLLQRGSLVAPSSPSALLSLGHRHFKNNLLPRHKQTLPPSCRLLKLRPTLSSAVCRPPTSHPNTRHTLPSNNHLPMADWNTPTGTSEVSDSSRHSELTLLTAAAGDGGWTADDSWTPQETTTGGGGGGFEDDTGYTGQNISKHAGGDGGCRK